MLRRLLLALLLRLAFAALVSFCAALACATKEEADKPLSPTPEAAWELAAERLVSRFMPDGWVVCLQKDQAPHCEGDSLLFTSIAMGTLDCRRAHYAEAALLKMLTLNGYMLYRHPNMPSEWSLDGAIGFYWGVAKYVTNCPDARGRWREAMLAHQRAIDGKLELHFATMLREVLFELGAGDRPSEEERGRLGAEVAAWAFATTQGRKAAYRVHLGFLTLDVIDAPNGRVAFCASVREASMPVVEHFCGRPGLQAWIDAFSFNTWEYAHQRSPVWETPDASRIVNGARVPVETAGLDLLFALRLLYPSL